MSREIESRQAEVEALHAEVFKDRIARRREQSSYPTAPSTVALSLSDTELLDRARNAKNGAKFSKLYDLGNTSDYRRGDNDGRSEAELALCMMLYFWCGNDPERIERLLRGSALMRDKLNRADYIQCTIAAALARCGPTYSGGQISI